jgi:pyruvate-formate lyase
MQATIQKPDRQKRPEAVGSYDFERELRFTETYRRHASSHKALREAACLREQFPGALGRIRAGDLFAGRLDPPLVGFSPDEWGQAAFGYYCLGDAILTKAAESALDDARLRAIHEMVDFWSREQTSARLRAAYPPQMAAHLPSDDWMNQSGIAFPLYRITGANVDFGKLVALGLPGLAESVRARKGAEDDPFLDGLLSAIEVVADAARWYASKAREGAIAAEPAGRKELEDMARVLDAVATRAPKTFREAAQLVWLYSIVADVRNYGRMDVYLGGFLAADLDEGRLDEAGALTLLRSLWGLMADRGTRVHGRIIVGGRGRPDPGSADRFALLAMEATRTVPAVEPQLSLRFHRDQDPALMDRALDVLAEGRTFPILYNDDVNVPSFCRAFGMQELDGERYVPYGCGEYILDHGGIGTPSGVINLLKALSVTLHGGTDPVTGRKMGLGLGSMADFRTFEDLWNAYAGQVEFFVEMMAEQEALEYRVAGDQAAFLHLSLLYDHCLERGLPLLDGGIRHLGGTLETYGNTNTADSLTAIRRLVYGERALTPAELMAAIDADFDGFQGIRRQLEGAPKYGNDDDEADRMLVRVHEHVCHHTRMQADRVGLDSYQVVIINNSANTLMGRQTEASADGRRAFTPMNNGNAPSSGNDRSGATALLNSLVKPATDIHAGAVQNMKFSRSLFDGDRPRLKALLDTWFDLGGQQAMITVVNREDLENAMRNPEDYGHLFVRVGGFSARFVDLPPDVQREILERTLY